MNRQAAMSDIQSIFSKYKTISTTDIQLLQAMTDGKLYELFVLSDVIESLSQRGFSLTFKGSSLKFKASPGQIKLADPHFELVSPHGQQFWLFVDIEFETLGSSQGSGANDHSRRHEIDIVVVSVSQGYPKYDEIALGVECKAVANFGKSIVKEVLGVRRELSLLSDKQPSTLTMSGGSPPEDVRANPPSEYWLAYTDLKGNQYQSSPSAFSIGFKNLKP